MAYEVRGSMMVFLILIVTASFTPRHRAATFFFLIAYSMYADADVLLNIPFFVGALLADLSIVCDNSPILPIWNVECFGRRVAGVRVHWPILVFVLGLFFGSYPPNSYEQRSWSTMLHGFKEVVLPEACKYLSPLSDHRGLPMDILLPRGGMRHLLNALFPPSP